MHWRAYHLSHNMLVLQSVGSIYSDIRECIWHIHEIIIVALEFRSFSLPNGVEVLVLIIYQFRNTNSLYNFL